MAPQHKYVSYLLTLGFLLGVACSRGEQEPDSKPTITAAITAEIGEKTPQPANPTVHPPLVENPIPLGYKIGKRPPEFALNLATGETITSTSLAAQKRPLFILFHASW